MCVRARIRAYLRDEATPNKHTGERAAILKLNFHEFDEKELLRAEFL